MSEPVKKLQWGYTGMIPFSETAEKLGLYAYVQIENYQFMQKRADNLESENARLKAEVERLRKAGDALQKRLYVLENPTHPEVYLKLLSAWNAAKEGKPSV